MKKYVFLTEHLSGLTGSERYVNNKCKFLRENGWEVIVLWNYDIAPVQLEHLICFDKKDYIHHELKFFPSWFSKRGREKVLDRLTSLIGDADQIVIESSKLEIGAWGELLAAKIRCKHFVFVLTENIKIENKSTFDFCYAKLKRMEFFTITESAVKYMFSNFVKIEHPEYYYWSATPGVDVVEYAFPSFDNLPQADYTITSFGRTKEYFPYMLKELNLFILQHSEKTFNLFFIGGISNENLIRNSLQLDNIHLVIYPQEVKVVPRQIFTKSDVVIASSGCAWLSAKNGAKTISMDVTRQFPLGLLQYTTLDSNTNSGKYENNKSLSDWLQSLLIKKTEYTLLDNPRVPHGFDYQMQNVNQYDYKYIDSTKVNEPMTKHDRFFAFLVRIGLFHLVEYFYYKRRGVKIIWR